MTCISQNEHLKFSLYFALVLVTFVSPSTLEQSPSNRRSSNGTRRILRGTEVHDRLPYMVYLRAATSEMKSKDDNWLCGGVIVHEQYILTSAACIEDAKRFYVISGTHRWVPLDENDDDCIKNGAKRATWKVVPKNYVYDGDHLNNIHWMMNDIAVVRVEDNFNFDKRVRGCDFIPQKISYNNQSEDLEAPGTSGTIAGWGSVDSFGDIFGRPTENSPTLLEADVVVTTKKNCKRNWPERYRYIIDESMICTKDDGITEPSQICLEEGGNCQELVYSDEDKTAMRARRFKGNLDKLEVHTAAHEKSLRKAATQLHGGFCENDHGGPLVVGYGPASVVIGIISACLTTNVTQKCYGPFLYTSVWKNRHIINCAIDRTATCTKYLRSSNSQMEETQFDWSNHRPYEVDIEAENSRYENRNIRVQAKETRSTPKKKKKIYG